MTIIETTVWVDILRGRRTPQTSWIQEHMRKEEFGLTDLILCEVLQGVRDGARYAANRRDLLRLAVFETCGSILAQASAENYRLLRQRGITVRSTVDCIIATFCIREGHSLLHNDRDYDPFERHLDLKVIHP